MKRWRWLLAIALVGLIVVGAYFAGTSQQARTTTARPNDADTVAYDYEANTVTVRQMDANGQLQYELEAQHISQLPQNGAVTASMLTMHYDPPGQHDESRRWKLTADSAQLPENSDIVALKGHVVARGRPAKSPAVMTFSANSFNYNLKTQVLITREDFRADWAGNRFGGTGLEANIKQGTIEKVESNANGQIRP